ncbi:hypothetical protein HU200_006017 [Digitaria exilis]|uniref:SIAH-type domain-containing protein n=1 Tax=Digitaria exilis TaxID=1010633 RepID=A0A835FSW3_9POAL|nr:hypothetical protein HU200_006017 [Digitaria exilis]
MASLLGCHRVLVTVAQKRKPSSLWPMEAGDASPTSELLAPPPPPPESVKRRGKRGRDGPMLTKVKTENWFKPHHKEKKQSYHPTIQVDKAKLYCSLCACALTPPIYQCAVGHLACCSCRVKLPARRCRTCRDRGGPYSAYTHCPGLDLFFGDLRVPCDFDEFGCRAIVPYFLSANHKGTCEHAPCHCPEPGCSLLLSPRTLAGHLAVNHDWAVYDVAYGTPLPLSVPVPAAAAAAAAAPSPAMTPARNLRLLRGEDASLFLMAVGPLGDGAAVSVVLARATANPPALPRYTCTFYANPPPRAADLRGSYFFATVPVRSSALADGAGVAPEKELYFAVPREMLCGANRELLLSVRIDRSSGPEPPYGVSRADAAPTSELPPTEGSGKRARKEGPLLFGVQLIEHDGTQDELVQAEAGSGRHGHKGRCAGRAPSRHMATIIGTKVYLVKQEAQVRDVAQVGRASRAKSLRPLSPYLQSYGRSSSSSPSPRPAPPHFSSSVTTMPGKLQVPLTLAAELAYVCLRAGRVQAWRSCILLMASSVRHATSSCMPMIAVARWCAPHAARRGTRPEQGSQNRTGWPNRRPTCEAGHRLCRGEGGCRRCGLDTTFVHCGPDLDEYAAGFTAPCPFEAYGSASAVVYHTAAAHRDACAYASCTCAVAGCAFAGSPRPPRRRALVARASRSASVSGPVDRLLVVDGDERRLFVMSVRPRGASCCAVTVACVRASGAADAGPRYWCYLTAYGPVASGVPGDCRYLAAMANVASCSVPGGAAGEEGMHGAGRAAPDVARAVQGDSSLAHHRRGQSTSSSSLAASGGVLMHHVTAGMRGLEQPELSLIKAHVTATCGVTDGYSDQMDRYPSFTVTHCAITKGDKKMAEQQKNKLPLTPIGERIGSSNSKTNKAPLAYGGVELRLLHCTVAECSRPLKPHLFKCEAGHRLCRGDDGRCLRCGLDDITFVHRGPDYVGAFTARCRFVAYGCASAFLYDDDDDDAAAAHRDACAYAPCPCAVSGCAFTASPPMLRGHLAAGHSWPVHTLPGYETPVDLRVPAPGSGTAHHLLAVDGDELRLFVMSVRARGVSGWAITVACVRASGAAEAGPRYGRFLAAHQPAAPGMPAWKNRRPAWPVVDVASCAALEERMPLAVPHLVPRGPSEEIHLEVLIAVVNPAPASRIPAPAAVR